MDTAKCQEYREVAAILNMEIEMLLNISENPSITVEQLKRQIEIVAENKAKILTCPEFRKSRYDWFVLCFGIPSHWKLP